MQKTFDTSRGAIETRTAVVSHQKAIVAAADEETGGVSLATDLEGGSLGMEVDEESGVITVSEIDADGEPTGEMLEIVPPADDSDEG